MPRRKVAAVSSGCSTPGDSRQQILDDTGPGIGADQVHRLSIAERGRVPMQPSMRLVPAGKGTLSEHQTSRHACRAIGLVDGQPASVRTPMQQGPRLDDERADLSLGDPAISERVDRLDPEPLGHGTGQVRIRMHLKSDAGNTAKARSHGLRYVASYVHRFMPFVSRNMPD